MSSPRDKIEAKLGVSGPPLQRVRESPPTIPAHELLRRIGQGAYGEVWLARNALGTWRAVKIVYRDNFKDDRPYEREFAGIRRFEPLSRSNEGFVDVLQVGRDDAEGYFYYVMELADDASTHTLRRDVLRESQASPEIGESGTRGTRPSDDYAPRTLARDLAQLSRLPLEDCLELGLTLTLALGHLHRHGLIHRDIKPSNIIFVGGVPKLADIGLVTEAQGANTFVGTEGFVPPEGPTSPQADLYALGKVLYEAAMGKDRNEFPEPFTQIGADRESIALMELNAVLLRACAPDPKKRYGSAQEMHADLALLHSGGSVKRRHLFDRQFQIAKRVGAVAMAATILIGGAWVWQRQETQKMTRLAEDKSTLATEKSKLADNLAKLGEENRNRIVRLDIANGIQLLDEGDPAGALLWFADALPLLKTRPAEESIHRIRIQQVFNQIPRPTLVLAPEQPIKSCVSSPDGKRLATVTEKMWLQVWDVGTGAPLMEPVPLRLAGDRIRQLGFTTDGKRFFASTVLAGLGDAAQRVPTTSAVVLDWASGQPLFSKVATNLAHAEFTPDGRWLVAEGSDHEISVFDVQNGSQVSSLRGHTNDIIAFSFSTNGTLLASTSEDHTIRLWRLPFGEPIGTPLAFQPPQHPPALSQDGERLATREEIASNGVTNEFIRVWKTENLTRVGRPIESPSTGEGAIGFIELAGRRCLFDLYGGRLRLFDPDTQTELLPPILPSGRMQTWYAISDGRYCSAGPEGMAGIWSLETGELLAPPFRPGQFVDADLSHDGFHLATVSDQGACVLWNVKFRKEDAIHYFGSNIPTPIADRPRQLLLNSFSPDRKRFLTILADGSVRLVDVEDLAERELPEIEHRGVAPRQCIFGPNGSQWAILYNYTSLREDVSPLAVLWREEAGALRSQIITHPQGIRRNPPVPGSSIGYRWSNADGTSFRLTPSAGILNMRFAPDGASLVTVFNDPQIRIWRAADGTLERSVAAPDTLVTGVVFPDGRTCFLLDRAAGFALFDLLTQKVLPVSVEPATINAFAFDPSHGRFATATAEGWARVWSARTGAPLSPPLRHGGILSCVDWSPNGKRIATAGFTPEVRMWDATTGAQVLPPLRIGDKPIVTTAWSLDGRFIVARSDEKMARVWDAATGEAVTPLLKHEGYVHLAHLAANNRLITLSQPNKLRVWDLRESPLPAAVLADYAKLVSGRKLNSDGLVLPLKAVELRELNRSLRTRAPQLFK